MSRARRAFASRANGRMSRGPTTAAGAVRRARGALRHGLSVPVLADPGISAEVDTAARAIAASVAGGPLDADRHVLACRIAEAMIDLRRVRAAKLPLVAALYADPTDFCALAELARLDRYERRAHARRATAVRELDAALAAPLRPHPEPHRARRPSSASS
jgi:hypothetical protein